MALKGTSTAGYPEEIRQFVVSTDNYIIIITKSADFSFLEVGYVAKRIILNYMATGAVFFT